MAIDPLPVPSVSFCKEGRKATLREALDALEPMLHPLLFFLTDFEIERYASSEARAWAMLCVEPSSPYLEGGEPFLLSFRNLINLTKVAEGLHEVLICIGVTGDCLTENKWVAVFSDDFPDLVLGSPNPQFLTRATELAQIGGLTVGVPDSPVHMVVVESRRRTFARVFQVMGKK